MIYALINEGQIVGTSDTKEGLPQGFEAIETPDGFTIDTHYFDVKAKKSKIKPRPPKPSENATWFGHEWREPEPETFTPTSINNWSGLLQSLRGSDLWAKVFAASSGSLKAQSAWTLLYGTLTSTRNVDDLAFAIEAFRAASPKTLTPSDLEAIASLLEESGFTQVELFDALSTTESAQ